MRRSIAAVLLLVVASGGEVWAQRSADLALNVSANNRGVFACALDLANFDFGDVDVLGTDYGMTKVVAQGRNPTNTGGLYESAPGAVTWGCAAAPASTARIALVSSAADHTAGGMNPDALEVRIRDAAGGASTGYQPFTSKGTLISDLALENGQKAVAGDLDLRLNVLDTDPKGINRWVVRLVVTGNP